MKTNTALLLIVLAALVSLPPTLARPPYISDPAYPAYYPAKVPIKVGTLGQGYALQSSYLLGPEYWKSLPPSTRKRLNTFAKLRRYAQDHEGTPGLYAKRPVSK